MKLTVHEFMTIDGVVQGPGGVDEDPNDGFDKGGWIVPFVDEDFGRVVGAWFGEVDEFLMGRRTYEMMHAFWSQITDPDDPAAATLNGLPKHVASTTLSEVTWHNARLIEGDVVEAVRRLKERSGRELQVHGCRGLVRTLHDAGLVDEYRLLVVPVVLGHGKQLFPSGAATTGLEPVHTEVLGSGAVYHVLRPTPFVSGGIAVEDGREVLTD